MTNALSRFTDRLLGRASAAVTVPALDGALKPNNVLEDLAPGIAGETPDNVVIWQGAPLWSDGRRLVTQDGMRLDLGSAVTALAANGSRLAVATQEDGMHLLDLDLRDVSPQWTRAVRNITALAFAPDGGLWFCMGSARNAPEDWRRDLMEKSRSGVVGRADPESGDILIRAERLGYPNGLVVDPNGDVVLSEAWSSHLLKIPARGGANEIVLDEIPGYPGRIVTREKGGYWLSIFAPRSQLIEFVLREPGYRKAMLREVEPQYWVAPAYRSGDSFMEPLQGGALKQMGILKPWAPTRSYGLVVELDSNFVPLRSFHSRAGGRRHGITSAAEAGGKLWLTSRGAGEVLTIDLGSEGESA
ncbi:strictosidine synthase [Breoghania sp. JC706]|uniref:strictosidine synthase n=1 Tax=Breoghania sp. JC706 TaxID=3117732 RepID=UPI00300B573C